MKTSRRQFFRVLIGCMAVVQLVGANNIAVTVDKHYPSGQEMERNTHSSLNRDPAKLMKLVANRYRNITSFRCHGLNSHTSRFEGKEKAEAPIRFEIEYTPGQSSFIRWEQDKQKKVFTVNGEKTWIDIDGKREREFPNSRDGLMIVESAGKGRSLFSINVFIFRDELKLGNRFFLGLNEPWVVEEREEAGRNHYLLTGSFRNVEATQTFWIDTETYLITKIQRIMTIRTKGDDKEYVSVERTEETYSNIEIK